VVEKAGSECWWNEIIDWDDAGETDLERQDEGWTADELSSQQRDLCPAPGQLSTSTPSYTCSTPAHPPSYTPAHRHTHRHTLIDIHIDTHMVATWNCDSHKSLITWIYLHNSLLQAQHNTKLLPKLHNLLKYPLPYSTTKIPIFFKLHDGPILKIAPSSVF